MIELLRLTRPINCFLAGAGSLVGTWLAYHSLNPPDGVLAAVITALVTAGGNALNDLSDVDADQRSHPERPLASGRVSQSAAVGLISLTWGSGALLTSVYLSDASATLVLVVSGLLISYSLRLKRLPLIGNLVIAFLGALPILFGGVVGRSELQGPLPTLLLAALILAFLGHLARELVKSIEDMAGDQLQGRRTLPLVAGKRFALCLALVVLSTIPVASVLLVGWTSASTVPLILITLGTVVLMGIGGQAILSGKPAHIHRLSSGLKLGLAAGMAILLWLSRN